MKTIDADSYNTKNKDSTQDVNDYHPISLLSIQKIFEKFIHSRFVKFLDQKTYKSQGWLSQETLYLFTHLLISRSLLGPKNQKC